MLANVSKPFSTSTSHPLTDVPAVSVEHFRAPAPEDLGQPVRSVHPPRILLLYGSLRERSFSRLLVEEAARLLQAMGAEAKVFNPTGLPLPDDAPDSHPKVQELRSLAQWSEGMVWCSPERHGAMTGIMKTQIDWIPLSSGAVRPWQIRRWLRRRSSGPGGRRESSRHWVRVHRWSCRSRQRPHRC